MTYFTCFPWCIQFASSSLVGMLVFGFSSFDELEKMFIGDDISALFWMKVWHIAMLKLPQHSPYYCLCDESSCFWILNIANVLWFCGFKICYVVSQSWIALHLCAPFHKKTFCCSCLKPPRLGKTHLTSCVGHLCSWVPMVLSICLQMLLVLL